MRRGFSLLEVLVATVLFLVLLAPLTRMMMGANRAGVAANRLLEVTAYGQTVLEAVELLTPADLGAAIPAGSSGPYTVHESLGVPLATAPGTSPPAVPGGEVTLEKITTYLEQARFPFQLGKRLTLENLSGGHVAVELRLNFPRLPTEPEALHTVLLRGTLARRLP